MLPTARNKLTMSILGRLKQQGPPPPGGMQPFSPLDGTSQGQPGQSGQPTDPSAEDDLGRTETPEEPAGDLFTQASLKKKKSLPK